MEGTPNLTALRIRIEKLQSRRRELEAILAGIDSRYLLGQQAHDALMELQENAELLERLTKEANLIEEIERRNHEQEGEELTTEWTMRFERIDQAEEQHNAALARLTQEREQLAAEVTQAMAAHSERLAQLLRAHVPYTDEVVVFARANLAYREQMESLGPDPSRFVERTGMEYRFLRIEPNQPPDWRRAEGDELAFWLQRYIDERRP